MTMKINKIFVVLFLLLIAFVFVGCGKEPTEIKINNEKLEYTIGEEVSIQYTILPDDCKNKEVAFSSSNESIATVTDAGLVKFVGEGEVVITVASKAKESVSNKVTFKVVKGEILPTEIKLTYEKTEVSLGETLEISCEVLPADAANKEVVWSSSDESIATVKDGIVTTKKAGKVTITCKASKDEKISKSVELTITDILPEQMEITCESDNIYVGDEFTFIVSFTPANTSNKNVEIKSSDETIVSVKDNKLVALKEGEVQITITSQAKKELTKTVTVVVNAKPYEVEAFQNDINNLIKSYLNSQAGSLIIETNNGKELLTQRYAFELVDGQVSKLMNELSGANSSAIYIKDGIIYMNANGNKVQYEGDEEEALEAYQATSIATCLDSINKIYSEKELFAALKYVNKKDGAFEYSLDIRNYKGSVLNTFNKDEIKVLVKLNGTEISEVSLVTISEEVETSIKVSFSGLNFAFDFPQDLNEYVVE